MSNFAIKQIDLSTFVGTTAITTLGTITTGVWNGTAIAHSSLSSLTTGDPHTQYLYSSPSSSSRNVIGGLSTDATTRLLRLEANYSLDVGGPYSLFEIGVTSASTQFAIKGSAGGLTVNLDGTLAVANANSINFFGSGASSAKYIALKSPSSLSNNTRTLTLPQSTSTLPAVDLAQTWSGTQTFSSVDSINGYSLTGRGLNRLLVASRQSATATGSGDVNLYTYSVAANTLGTTKGIRFRFIAKRTTGSGTVAFKLKWGGVRFDAVTANTGPSYIVQGELWANGSTSSQFDYTFFQGLSAAGGFTQAGQLTNFTSDTTNSVNLALDIALTTTTDVVTLSAVTIELLEV